MKSTPVIQPRFDFDLPITDSEYEFCEGAWACASMWVALTVYLMRSHMVPLFC